MQMEEKFQTLIGQLNKCILEQTNSRQELVNLAIEDLVSGGGKRIRPILTILAGRFGDFQERKMLKLASSLELLHMASLVHDDIIDEAEIRRGRDSAQSKFGKKVAVFIGDFLLSKSYDVLARKLSRNSLHRLNKIVRLICEGEISQFEEKFDFNVSVSDYLRRIRRKTALLFGLSTYIGAYESGLRGTLLHNIYNLGLEMGMTFQIQDDILDFTGNEKDTGKKVGRDLASGIYTLPVIYLLMDEELDKQTREILSKGELSDSDLISIDKLIKKGNCIEKSKVLSKKYLDKACRHLDKLPDISAKKDMEYIIDFQLNREN